MLDVRRLQVARPLRHGVLPLQQEEADGAQELQKTDDKREGEGEGEGERDTHTHTRRERHSMVTTGTAKPSTGARRIDTNAASARQKGS